VTSLYTGKKKEERKKERNEERKEKRKKRRERREGEGRGRHGHPWVVDRGQGRQWRGLSSGLGGRRPRGRREMEVCGDVDDNNDVDG